MQVIRRRPVAAAAPAQAPQPAKKPYLMLQAWNLFMRCPQRWNVERAQEENAPDNAIYRHHEGHWVVSDCLDVIPGHPFHAYSADFIAKNSKA